MPSGQFSGFKRFLLWDYPRAGWQYDVMVALILAFIFITPREIFRDQPRASNIARLPAEDGTSVFWIEPELLKSYSESERGGRVQAILKSRFGKTVTVVRLEPIFDSEQEVKGFMALTRP
ncbi:MAG TPA: hypothetical protein VMZ52_18275 [Bryobacteraceae bacterium]|nr:hypothetical protein [Bryobacteraceae bacterium]